MNEKDFVRLLQHHRHDLMNEFQIVHGYLSIGKIDMVKDKVDHIISYYNKERNLINLDAPHFILWILQANHLYENIRVTYEIELKHVHLKSIDQELVNLGTFLIDTLKKYGNNNELYHINILLFQVDNESSVNFQSSVIGQFSNEKGIINHFESVIKTCPLIFEKTENGYLCNYIF